MMDLDTYQSLLKKMKELQRDYDKVQVALEHLKDEMEREFNVKSIKEARVKLSELRSEVDRIDREADRLEADWRQKHGDRI